MLEESKEKVLGTWKVARAQKFYFRNFELLRQAVENAVEKNMTYMLSIMRILKETKRLAFLALAKRLEIVCRKKYLNILFIQSNRAIGCAAILHND